MRKIRRLVAIGAMATLTVALGACSSAQEPAAPASKPAPPSSQAAPAGNGVTGIGDIAGPACSQVPTEGPGSAQGMVDDPVATAASNNPLLTTLVQAVKTANLVDTLNSAPGITVFAPINPAFAALPPGTVDQLVKAPDAAQPTSKLSQILKTHVVGTRMTAEDLQKAGTVDSLQGSRLTVGGTAPDALTVSSGGVTAKVVCANVPTKNATVFLIDSVLMPGTA